ncbi:sensor histidine kinase [Mucilaginibacter calamicampi]|uniref:Sensor histidine kinase n=1 Tax=Mucilaginibacter calamicampi TaxID=1302352 RepID=A0ABW2YY98_9SPHI
MKTKALSFIKDWLLHFAALIFLFNFFDTIDFISKRARWGDFLRDDDGTPDTVSDRIIRHTFHNPEIFEMMAFTLLVDLLYRFVFKKYRWPVFIIVSAICCCLVLGAHALFTHRELTGILQLLGVLMGYVVGYALLREFFHHKLYALDVRLGKSENELNVLKQQLDPHFLFNTLNYLYGTALREKAESTAKGIEVMSGMMRYSVEGMQQTFVPLADEVNFIEQYLYLQRVRLPERTSNGIRVTVAIPDKACIIAPMLLIPFIENAFKHGISNDSSVDINIDIRSTGNVLTMKINNSIHSENLVKGTNSGLSITKRRLELLYPYKHQLEIKAGMDRYDVLLVLTLQPLNK